MEAVLQHNVKYKKTCRPEWSEEEKKILFEAHQQFKTWKESLGCGNGELIVYGRLVESKSRREGDSIWFLHDLVSAVDGTSLEIKGTNYATSIFVGRLDPELVQKISDKRVAAVVELAQERLLIRQGYKLSARLFTTEIGEPKWAEITDKTNRITSLRAHIESLEKEHQDLQKRQDKAISEFADFESYIQKQKKDLEAEIQIDSNELQTIKSQIKQLNTKRKSLGFETDQEKIVNDTQYSFYPLQEIAKHAHATIVSQGGIYTLNTIKDFTALLATNDLIVLAGNSGTGKTNLCREYARVIGGVCHIIPVKPNWTSSDDLLGFYSPIEKRLLKSPFLEAMLAASKDPNRLHIICLDEMNLARPECYFADFLSVLENRSSERIIELNIPQQSAQSLSTDQEIKHLVLKHFDEKSGKKGLFSDASVKEQLFKLTETDSEDGFWLKWTKIVDSDFETSGRFKIPSNVRFVGTMNVDETTNFFSPKVLDRVHIMRLENPLFIEEETVSKVSTNTLPLSVTAESFGAISSYPHYDASNPIVKELLSLGKDVFLPLHIDISLRTMRQAMLYAEVASKVELTQQEVISYFVQHKLLPRCVIETRFDQQNQVDKFNSLLKRVEKTWPRSCVKQIRALIDMGKDTGSINWWLV